MIIFRPMRNFFPLFAVFVLVSLLFQSCKKEESLSFNYSGEKIIMTLKPNANTPVNFDTTNSVYFNADSMATANKFPREALKDITITDMEFTLLTPSSIENFDKIESMNGSIATIEKTNLVNIFSTDKISQRTSEKIVVSGINQNIKDKVFNNKFFTFSLNGTLNDSLRETIKIEVKFTYAVSMLGVKI